MEDVELYDRTMQSAILPDGNILLSTGDDDEVDDDDGQSSCSLLSVDVFVVCGDDEGHNSVSL